ncbi:MAG: branched-chain amino acid ABC transporter permease, partial [SAR324 cluster bacterium]|nr:branched-chain amino acid ABC transporter permease [SAR324 cluster bacterium]
AGLSLKLLSKEVGLISLGHSAWLAIGAYGSALTLQVGGAWWLSLLIGVSLGAMSGLLLGWTTERLQGTSLTVSTLVAALLIQESLLLAENWTGGYSGISVDTPDFLGGSTNQYWGYWMSLLALSGAWLCWQQLKESTIGRCWRASKDSSQAMCLGINPQRARQQALVWSGGIAALSGILLAWQLQYLSPEAFPLTLSLEILLIGLLGSSNLWGLLFGAALVRFLPQLLALVRMNLPSSWQDLPGLEPLVFGLILICWIWQKR